MVAIITEFRNYKVMNLPLPDYPIKWLCYIHKLTFLSHLIFPDMTKSRNGMKNGMMHGMGKLYGKATLLI